jgi:hypothetical protein
MLLNLGHGLNLWKWKIMAINVGVRLSPWYYNQFLAQVAKVLMYIDMEDPQKGNLATDA